MHAQTMAHLQQAKLCWDEGVVVRQVQLRQRLAALPLLQRGAAQGAHAVCEEF